MDHRAYFDSGISFFDFEVIFACISGDDMGVIENHVYLFVDNEATDCFDVAGRIENNDRATGGRSQIRCQPVPGTKSKAYCPLRVQSAIRSVAHRTNKSYWHDEEMLWFVGSGCS